MRRNWQITGAAFLLVAALATGTRFSSANVARRKARALFQRSEQAHIQGQRTREFDLLLQSVSTDASYLPAIWELKHHTLAQDMYSSVAPRINRALASTPDVQLRECARSITLIPYEWYAHFDAAQQKTRAARECVELYNLLAGSATMTAYDSAALLTLWRRYPESPAAAVETMTGVVRQRAWRLGKTIGREMSHANTPLVRAQGFAMLRTAFAAENNDSAVQRVEKDALDALMPLGPGVYYYYLEVLGRRRATPDSWVRSQTDPVARYSWLYNDAIEAYSDGDLARSDSLFNLLLRDYGNVAEVRATALVYRGRTHLKAGELAAAEKDLLAARRDAVSTHLIGMQIEISHNLFHVYESAGKPAQALAAGRAFISATQVVGRMPMRMMSYHDVGWYYWRVGKYESARTLLGEMLLRIDSMRYFRHYAGEYYERIGDLEKALALYTLSDSLEHVDARSVGRMALLAAQMGDSTRAVRLAMRHDTIMDPHYPEFTPLLPSVLSAFGLRERALAAASNALATARRRNQAAAVANLQLQTAQLELDLGRPAMARTLADSAIVAAHRVAAFETEVNARGVSALAAVVEGRDPNAIIRLAALLHEPAVRHLPQLQLSTRIRLGEAHAFRSDLDAALRAYAGAADVNDSLAASLNNDADRASLRSAQNDVSGKALTQILRSNGAARVPMFAAWSTRRKARLLSESRAISVTVPKLDHGTAIIDYVVLDSLVGALVVKHDAAFLKILPVDARTLRNQVRSFRSSLTPRIGSAIDEARSTYDATTAHELYLELLGPFISELGDVDELIIVPDGALHGLPFDALATRPIQSNRASYVLERYTVRYAPSLALTGREPVVRKGALLAVAGDAPDAVAELVAIRAAARGLQVRSLAADSATERNVRVFGAGAGIIHFATHATPNDVQPLFAFLALRADNTDDGRLHAFEIGTWRLERPLIVLSGCDTGSGRLAGGEGVLSLSRAFLRAGAAATVATLWPVGRSVPDLMTAFYGSLAQGASPAHALRAAKLSALKGPHKSPLYWAPFVLIST